MIQYIKVGKISDFSTKNYKCIKVLTRSILVVKREDNSFYAIEANCRHQNALLPVGSIPKDFQVTCPRHGWRYDLKTGECLSPSSGEPLRFFPLKVEEEEIYVGTRPKTQ